MKRYALLIVMIAGFTMTGFAQKSSAPAVVKSVFAKAFPGASKVKWVKEKMDYEANFMQGGKEMAAVYDAQGVLKETEVDIKSSELPAGVTDYIKQHYKGAAIKEAAKITKANGEVNYEAEVNRKDIIFNAAGKFLKEEKDED